MDCRSGFGQHAQNIPGTFSDSVTTGGCRHFGSGFKVENHAPKNLGTVISGWDLVRKGLLGEEKIEAEVGYLSHTMVAALG